MLVLPPVSQGRIAMLASQFTSEDMNTLSVTYGRVCATLGITASSVDADRRNRAASVLSSLARRGDCRAAALERRAIKVLKP